MKPITKNDLNAIRGVDTPSVLPPKSQRIQKSTKSAKKKRHDPSDKSWQPLFLTHLALSANVSASIAASGVAAHIIYDCRKKDEAFAIQWIEAMDVAIDSLENEARRRAIEGVREVVYYRGEQIGEVTKYSDTLLIFLLKGARPSKYREYGTNKSDDSRTPVFVRAGRAPKVKLKGSAK